MNGVVRNVYSVDMWQKDSQGKEGRFEFFGKEASDDIKMLFLNKRIPENYRKKGMASPVLYHK